MINIGKNMKETRVKDNFKAIVRELAYTQHLTAVEDLTPNMLRELTAAYMDGLSISDQLEMVVDSQSTPFLTYIKATLRGEGAGAYGLMDPKNLLIHELQLGLILWVRDEIEDHLEDVLAEIAADSHIY